MFVIGAFVFVVHVFDEIPMKEFLLFMFDLAGSHFGHVSWPILYFVFPFTDLCCVVLKILKMMLNAFITFLKVYEIELHCGIYAALM